MAKAVDQFRQADVTMWGIAALGIWAVAILGANLSALVPASVFGALHSSRLEGTTLNQLRTQVSSLVEETARMKRENNQLLQRFTMNEEAAGAVTQRVGALEISVPKLIEEAQAKDPGVDAIATGSIEDGKTVTFETEGGTVAVQQRPLVPGSNDVQLKVVPLTGTKPPAIAPDGSSPGIALGFPVQPDTAEAQWQELLAQVGTMLVGLSPVLADQDGTDGKILVAGPMIDRASAIELCARLDQVGVPCEPTAFAGKPVPLLN
ncbi:MAG: hypothetical protein JWQ89_1281 [Devosia sp.]|uniref:hypothetical protein n=1 Tax=Devosia sp. TaxID=1871048 RepID=UPI00260769B5|nr:hypothetical protein [Devosia sp.]MDB5539554.1 hypothetical protein [Devosia sp.]